MNYPVKHRLTVEGHACWPFRWDHERDSDGTATAAANGDLPVPQDCQARAEGIAQDQVDE